MTQPKPILVTWNDSKMAMGYLMREECTAEEARELIVHLYGDRGVSEIKVWQRISFSVDVTLKTSGQ